MLTLSKLFIQIPYILILATIYFSNANDDSK